MGLSIVINHQEMDLSDMADNLKAIFKNDFIVKNDIESSLELIKLLPSIKMIIIAHPKNTPHPKMVLDLLENEARNVPLVIFGRGEIPEYNKEEFEIHQLLDFEDKDKVLDVVADIFGISVRKIQENESNNSDNYVPISLNYLMRKEAQNVSVFKVQEMGDTRVFQKILVPSESRQDYFEHLKEEGIQELYVTSKDYDFLLKTKDEDEFSKKFELNPNRFYDEEDLKGLDIKDEKREEILAGLKKLGITPRTFDLCNTHIEKLFNRVASYHQLEIYLKKIFKTPNCFPYRKSHLVAYLGGQVLHNIKIENLEETLARWIFVSFFNDYPLLKKEEIEIRNDVDLQGAKLTPKERQTVKNHPKLAVQAIDECPNTPNGARTMILQHHGNNIGEGFPKFPHSTISPQAAIFMVVEEFIILYLTSKSSITDIITTIKDRLPTDKFKNAIEGLEMTCHEHMTQS